MIEWQTGSEIGTIGFYLQRADGRSNRFVTVSDELIPSVGEPQGGVYTFQDPTAVAEKKYRYRLLELEAGGKQNTYGPFAVSFTGSDRVVTTKSMMSTALYPSSFSRAAYSNKPHRSVKAERKKKRLVSFAKNKRKPHSLARKNKNGALKLAVREAGFYHLSSREIAEATGLSLARTERLISRTKFQLTTEGKQVAWIAQINDTGLFFYGEGIESPYTEERIYWLEKGRGRQMRTVQSATPWQVPEDQTFVSHLVLEEDILPFSSFADDMDSDYWYWQRLISDHSTIGNASFDMTLDSIAGYGEATLDVLVRGIPLTGFSESHRLSVSINGSVVGEVGWSGDALTKLSIPFSQDILANGTNQVVVTGVSVSGDKNSYIVVDSLELQYNRYYQADGSSTLSLRGDLNDSVTVTGFADGDITVLDISKPRFPKLLGDVDSA